MRPGQLARQTGVSTDTLRYYERFGLLPTPKRTSGNYRDYAPSYPRRVALIQRALGIGFSLAELKAILSVRDQGGVPCRHVRRMLHTKICDLQKQRKALTLMLSQLTQLSKDWDRRLSRAGNGHAALLLESIPPEMHPALRSGLR